MDEDEEVTVQNFAPAEDVDAFRAQLKQKIDDDADTKMFFLTGAVAILLVILCVAVFVVASVLKTYKGTNVNSVPKPVNPCPQGAWVVAGPQCVYTPCAVFANGQLSPGYFANENDCLSSITGIYYPVAGSSNGINFASCSTQQGTLPTNWSSITTSTSYFGTNAQQLCQTDAANYNSTVAKIGVTCDPQNGPSLCSPSDGTTCVANQQTLQNPYDFSLSGCNLWRACDTANNNACVQVYGSPSNFQGNPPPSNPLIGGCGTFPDPCTPCPNTCFTFDSSKQAAALPGPGTNFQTGSGVESVTFTQGTCPAGVNQCTSATDCCTQIQNALGLTYDLYPSNTECPTSSGSFSCMADSSMVTGACQQQTDPASPSPCYQLVPVSPVNGVAYYNCIPYDSSQGDNVVAFSSQAKCQAMASTFNNANIGLECDPVHGPITCDASGGGTSTCTPITTIVQNNPSASDLPYNIGLYTSSTGKDPAKNALVNACVQRTADCEPDTCSPSCSFSTDTTQTACSQCTCSKGACTQTGWECSLSADKGAICSLTGAPGTTISQACTALNPNASVCGCSCIVPVSNQPTAQQCVENQIIGKPCDALYPDASGNMMPLSYVCGNGMLQSAQVLDVATLACVSGVPVNEAGKQFSVYTAPTTPATPLCPYNESQAKFALASNNQAVANTVYFVNDPNATTTQMIQPCPYEVYESCHGSNPILPPGQDVPFCSFGQFSGQSVIGGFSPSQAMCLASVVDLGVSQNANVPVCISTQGSGATTNVVVTGCVDAGAPGSTQGKPILDTGDLFNSCGTCSNTGNMSSPSSQCPNAPQATGFSVLQDSTGNSCNSLTNWVSFLKGPNAPSNAAYILDQVQTPPTNTSILVPSLYAGLQGTVQGGALPFQTSLSCTTAPDIINNKLGYCSTSATTLTQGQCSNPPTQMQTCQ